MYIFMYMYIHTCIYLYMIYVSPCARSRTSPRSARVGVTDGTGHCVHIYIYI